MYEVHSFPVPEEVAAKAWCDEATYLKLYEHSVTDPETFWAEQWQAHRVVQAL